MVFAKLMLRETWSTLGSRSAKGVVKSWRSRENLVLIRWIYQNFILALAKIDH